MLRNDKVDVFPNDRHDILQIALVVLRNAHGLDARTVRRHGFLAQTADRQHAAAQRYLAGHGNLVTNRRAGQCRNQRRGDRHACGRAVLRNRCLREVNVQIVVLVEHRVDVQCLCLGAHECHSRLCALLHDRAEIAGDFDLAGARFNGHFDLEHFTADTRPRETVYNADLVLPAD